MSRMMDILELGIEMPIACLVRYYIVIWLPKYKKRGWNQSNLSFVQSERDISSLLRCMYNVYTVYTIQCNICNILV
jgi:hypothetical protein